MRRHCPHTRLMKSECVPIILAISLIAILTVSISYATHHIVDRSHPHLQKKLSIPGLGLTQLLNVVCKHTLFPDSCVRELSSFSIIPALVSPSHLVSLAVQAASARADEVYQLAIQSSTEQGLHLLESQCANDCIDLMAHAKDNLNAAVSKLSNLHVTDIRSLRSFLRDVKVWLSSSLSYQTACADGFELALGSIQVQIQDKQNYVTKVIGNGLILVDILAQIGDNLGDWLRGFPPMPPIIHLRRRLLSQNAERVSNAGDCEKLIDVYDGFPHWVSAAERKLLQAPTSPFGADVTVAQDGSGDFLNITDALMSIPQGYVDRYVIYIKEGIYEEVFNVTKDLENVTFVGDGIGYTVITGRRNVASGLFNTYRTSTVGISGKRFYARDITFQNNAGPAGHQAVALRAGADFLVFFRCSFEGYQDTLYALSSRQFYRECKIMGTVDFIFGNAIAIFQNCEIVARLPMQGQLNTLTAQGRKLSADVSGYSFQNCTIYGEANLLNASFNVRTYLGRPWKAYSRVVFLQSQMDALVAPEGWVPWNDSNPYIDTVYYGEFGNRGPGAATQQRVLWKGVKPNMSEEEATQFNVQNFIAGETWLSSFEVEYQNSLA
ncbi:hypothetical protein GOP47_0026844 [Adiantum capillus-veneris]|nr:hypothetical protein GOP47_0026844 [Adiantum capillus-veneris]